jgi:hypothetical protein
MVSEVTSLDDFFYGETVKRLKSISSRERRKRDLRIE